MAARQHFLDQLTRNDWDVFEGQLLKYAGGRYHEKGVEVKMAIDIALGAVNNNYDRLLLLSSDTDLLPAVSTAKQNGRHIRYIGFAHKPSYALMQHCSSWQLLKRDELDRLRLPRSIILRRCLTAPEFGS